jgi:O-antigen ligase
VPISGCPTTLDPSVGVRSAGTCARSRRLIHQLHFGAVRSSLQGKLLILVALFGVVLAQAPELFRATTNSKVVLLLPFLFAIGATSSEVIRPHYSPPRWMLLGLWLYLAVVTITILRGIGVAPTIATQRSAVLASAQFAILAWFSYRLLASAQTEEERWWRIIALALSPAVFVAFNLLIMKVKLPLITVPAQAKGAANGKTATFLSALGGHTTRSNLPLASGVNASGAISAAGFAAAAILALRVRRPSRVVTVSAALLCAYATLLSDSHAALLIALGLVLLFALRPHARRFSPVVVAAVASPAIVVGAVGLISTLGLQFVSRENGNGITTVDGRLRIWEAAWDAIKGSDLYHILFGYGAFGQLTSGASRNYASIFEGVTTEPLLNTVHDLPLQTMLDGGILAIAALLALGFAIFSSLGRVAAKAPSAPVQALSAIVIVLLLNGATEALPSYLFSESLATVMLVAGGALALAPRALAEPTRKHVPPSSWRSRPAPSTMVPISTARTTVEATGRHHVA